MNQTSQKADAGTITIKNNTTDSSVGTSTLTLKNLDGASELKDIYDFNFPYSPSSPVLEIYTNVEGNKFGIDAHPITTFGWNFDLAVKGTVTDVDNYLRYKITDTTDLTDKNLVMYDKANPAVQYELLMDGNYHNIGLPNLTHGTGEYANWRLDVIPEPSTIALLTLGTGALALRRKKKGN